LLLARGRIKASIRAWFERQGFVEVETGCLQISPGNETHLHAFRTEQIGTDLSRRDLYLHTSPEFAMKKLLAAGEDKIFTFAPVFRNREHGNLHASEFTMLEWYRAGAPYEQLWDDCAALLKIAAETTGLFEWRHRGRTSAPLKTYDWLTLDHATSTNRDALAERARAKGIQIGDDDSWADIFARVLTEKIEPYLGLYQPVMLCEYPLHEATLARPHKNDGRVAERFELYVCGIELANGFGELNDADEQRRRFEKAMDFLAALKHMPVASGCALGFDRLVMLATGAERIDQIIWTPLPDSKAGR
jgi:elongation factor P--(R)-beta-lysine ligase